MVVVAPGAGLGPSLPIGVGSGAGRRDEGEAEGPSAREARSSGTEFSSGKGVAKAA